MKDLTLQEHKRLKQYATALCIDSIRATTASGSGHPTSCLSIADIISVLFFNVLKYDVKTPKYYNNDRFILSKGHAAPIIYAAWKYLGVITDEELLTLRQVTSRLEGHPTPRLEYNEAATGSLGQGLSIGAGMALNAHLDNLPYNTYVLMGDGEIAEGSIWEAADFACHYKLNNLIGIVDCNGLGQSGPTLYSQNYERYLQKFKASGWNAYIVNGHDIKELLDTFEIISKEKNLPSVIIAKTIKGYRLENIQGKEGWHGKPLDKQTAEKAIAHLTTLLGGANCKIYIPKKPDVCSSVSCIKEINVQKLSLDNDKNTKLFDKDSKISTRKAYGYALASLGKEHKDIIVLDADVKNSTFTEIFGKESPEKFFQCFIAEQNMIGVAAGLARRGKIPFVATFGAFLTRAYDQLRMASIGQCSLRVCGSHCGVSIGQDGPSQMGLEDIAMISTLPNSIILYPSDGVSAYYLTGLSANYTQGISYVRTTRADVPVLYSKDEKFSLGGCKILKKDNRDVACIISAGITVHEALKAYELLKSQNIYVSIIDLYSIKPFDKETVMNVAKASGGRIVTVEDHYFYGGMGQIVASAVVNSGLHVDICAVNKISCSGTPEDLMKDAGIDYVSLAKIVTSGKIK